MTTKACLFGGALFAAGLGAHAQQFQFESRDGGAYSTSEGFVYASLGGVGGYDYFASYNPAAATFNLSYTSGVSIGTSKLTDDTMEAFASASPVGGSYAQARGFAYVSFDAGEQLHIVWDFSNEDPASSPFFSDISIVNMTLFNEEFGLDIANNAADVSGDTIFTPTPGHMYTIRLAAMAGTGGTTSANILVIVPAPGAAALVGVAGLGLVRRRRSPA